MKTMTALITAAALALGANAAFAKDCLLYTSDAADE